MAPHTRLAQSVRYDLLSLEAEARTINDRLLSATEEDTLGKIQERIRELRVQLGMTAG